MATAAEPQPANLPLPGGRKDATGRLHPLLTGQTKVPPAYFLRANGRTATLKTLGIGVPKEEWVRCPFPAFLVEHPEAGPILVDTGLHASVGVDAKQNLGRFGAVLFKGVETDAQRTVSAQLRARGIEPSAVTLVVMTHLHLDHASAMSDFPQATFVFSAREWEAATASGARFHGYVGGQFDHAFDYRTLDFDAPEADSFATFGRSYDLLGDGSVRVVFTPGHTHGHMSVILRLRSREVLLAGDAIYTLETMRDTHLPARTEDEHRFRRSLSEIQLYAKETPGALIVPGHDWDAWQELETLYD